MNHKNLLFVLILSIALEGTMSTLYAKPQHITLIADPKVLSIPIKDNAEPLVDLRQDKKISIGPSPEIPDNTNYTFMRKTVYDKLLQANAKLPAGLRLCLYEGYRSLELQQQLFTTQYQNVKSRHPNWSDEQLFNETTKLVSPVVNPNGSKNIPPHSTGAAVDVYLINDKGQALDMGIHPKDWMQDKDGLLSLTDSAHISKEAKANRQIMSQALASVGFVNYPTEYWHWSYGDRYWAFVSQKPHAIYNSMPKPLSIVAVEQPAHEKMLRSQAAPVPFPLNEDDQALIASMKDKLHHLQGVGLAAPQLNVSKQIIAVYIPESARLLRDNVDKNYDMHILINPSYKPLGNAQKLADFEGCYSVLSKAGKVPRFQTISLSYDDEEGHHHEQIAEGFYARVLQHEIDHLKGILILDRLTPDCVQGSMEDMRALRRSELSEEKRILFDKLMAVKSEKQE